MRGNSHIMSDLLNLNKLKVSVIVPVFNGETHLIQCLESVLNQTYKNFEVLIINDGSTDYSFKIAQDFIDLREVGRNFRIVTTENFGVSHARNLGISEAIGDFFAFLDCDDTWEEDKLQKQLDLFETHPDCIGSITSFFVVKQKASGYLKKIRLISHRNIVSLRKGWFSLEGNGGLISSTLVMRNSGMVRFNSNLSTGADLEFFLKACQAGKILIIKEPLVNYRLHGSQMHLNSEGLIKDIEFLIPKMVELNLSLKETTVRGNVLAMASLLEFAKGNYLDSYTFLKNSVKSNLFSPLRIFTSVISKRICGLNRLYYWRFLKFSLIRIGKN